MNEKVLNILGNGNEYYIGEEILNDLNKAGYDVIKVDLWQPISTAPKDGTRIIVYRPNARGKYISKVGLDYWSEELGDCWAKSNFETQPTHWQPLPNPPKGEQNETYYMGCSKLKS